MRVRGREGVWEKKGERGREGGKRKEEKERGKRREREGRGSVRVREGEREREMKRERGRGTMLRDWCFEDCVSYGKDGEQTLQHGVHVTRGP